MLDVKEGDHLALPTGNFSPPHKLTVTRVLASRVETDVGGTWNRKNGRRWGGDPKDRVIVEPWMPRHDLLVDAWTARHLAWQIEARLREHDLPAKVKAGALHHLREAAKALGMEVE
jgi:hypothetical protein